MGQVIGVALTDVLPFIDSLSTNQIVVSVIDTLALEQDDTQGPLREIINYTDNLFINQIIGTSGVKRYETISHTLTVSQRVGRVSEAVFTDTLNFIDATGRIFQIVDTLTFSDTYTVDFGSHTLDTLFFTDTLKCNIVFNNIPLISDTLTFISRATVYIIPYNVDPVEIPYIADLTTTRAPYITLTYNDEHLILRNPSFGNTYKFNYNRQQLESRGKNLIIGANSSYEYKKSVNTMTFTIEHLKQIDRVKLFSFLNRTIGQLIFINDHENVNRRVLITTPGIEFTQQDINNYSTTFDMEILDFEADVTPNELSILYVNNVVQLTN